MTVCTAITAVPFLLLSFVYSNTVPLGNIKFRVLGSLILGKYCTFVCGNLFGRIKLIEVYPPKQSSTYKSAILAEYTY